jgi:hypothetical protein
MTLLIAAYFLGFNSKSTLLDITNKFGSPISIESTNIEEENKFIYDRDGYTFTAYCDKSTKIDKMEVYGANPYVSYKSVKLGDDFASTIKKMGNPNSYVIEDDNITLIYCDSSFELCKFKPKYKYKVVKITVNIKNMSPKS